MLKLSLAPGEYLTIGENVVVQVYRAENGRTYLAIDAPREVPIVRVKAIFKCRPHKFHTPHMYG